MANSVTKQQPERPTQAGNRWLALLLPFWVLGGFAAAQLFLSSILWGLKLVGISFVAINQSVLDTVIAACVYVITLAIVIGVPWLVKKRRTTKQDIGLTRLPSWMDIGLAPAGFVIYFFFSAVLMYIIAQLVPGFNPDQIQSVGFDNLAQRYEYLLAFITLVVVAPFAEEVLFRGYLYGKLRKTVPIWVAMIITSALFGLIHGQWNVAIDVFVLSIVMCGLREITGSIWTGILLHTIKNGLAFYLLFINPTILNTIG